MTRFLFVLPLVLIASTAVAQQQGHDACARDVSRFCRAYMEQGDQVVLACLIGAEIPVIPLIGASSVAQLDESLAAVDLELTADQRAILDAAG